MPKPGGLPPVPEEVVEKELEVLRLRRERVTFTEIAKRVGYADRGGAYKAYKAALNRIYKPDVTELRAVEDQVLDDLLDTFLPKAKAGKIGAAQIVLRASERRARLHGLDHADGIAERLVQIEADKLRLVVLGIAAVLDHYGIPEEDRPEGKRVFMRAVRALPSRSSSKGDEGDDDMGAGLVPA